MYNLLMSGAGWQPASDSMSVGRTLEHTDDDIKAMFTKSGGALDLQAVLDLPTLLASETHHDGSQPPARVGRLTRVRLVGKDYQLDYVYDPDVPPIPNNALEELAGELGIGQWEFTRTHWAIKRADLFGALFKAGMGTRRQPKVFSLSDEPVSNKLVAVMMPFDVKFSPVYDALKVAASSAGMECKRADDIWIDDHIIQDVVTLICEAGVVVCDLTERNPNVFYEMGIAHALGKDVIMIAQNSNDVPFDVKHIRHLKYLGNAQGLGEMSTAVAKRLADLSKKK